ncbi:hypothetical protein YC2023_008060 [Brassica napus]
MDLRVVGWLRPQEVWLWPQVRLRPQVWLRPHVWLQPHVFLQPQVDGPFGRNNEIARLLEWNVEFDCFIIELHVGGFERPH